MNKVYITVGVLAALVLGIAAVTSRTDTIASEESNLAATGQADAQSKSVVITYTNTGFSPAVVTVPRGASVDFLNMSNRALRIAPVTDPKDATSVYIGFSQTRSTAFGETFGVSVTQPGIWAYKSLNSPDLVGVVIVE